MKEYLRLLIKKYRQKGLLIDTNLLILLIMGNYDVALIEKNKRTEKYSKEDYLVLRKFSDSFNRIITTPNILTGVSNLSPNFNKDINKKYFDEFSAFIQRAVEKYIKTLNLKTEEYFNPYGVSDSIIINLCKRGYLLITDDLKLFNFINAQKYEVLNFNHIRGYYQLPK